MAVEERAGLAGSHHRKKVAVCTSKGIVSQGLHYDGYLGILGG